MAAAEFDNLQSDSKEGMSADWSSVESLTEGTARVDVAHPPIDVVSWVVGRVSSAPPPTGKWHFDSSHDFLAPASSLGPPPGYGAVLCRIPNI